MQVKQRVKYYNDRVYWYFYDKWHRDRDLPARYSFENRKLYFVYYYQHGKLYRTAGPAIINYLDKWKDYYYEDKQYASLEEIQMLEACK